MTLAALPLAALPFHTEPVTRLPAPPLICWIDFKWLMGGEGHRVNLERLQCDADYARCCLALAQASGSATLRWAASRLAAAVQAMPESAAG